MKFSGIEVLTIVFVVLKLAGVIAWPWVWVLAPIWIVLALIAVILIGAAVVLGIIALIEAHEKKKGR